jgi:hypothetical protein
MKKIPAFLLLIYFFLAYGCKEVYHPELSISQKVLVVEGLITNEPVSHTILVSRAIPFDTSAMVPEKGASVFVTDNSGNKYYFIETVPGKYASDSSQFKPEFLRTYVLTIETTDKKIYTSSPQTLLAKGELDSVTYVVKDGKYVQSLNGNFRLQNVKGVDFFTTLHLAAENPYYRFSNTVLILYTTYERRGEGYLFYCWKKFFPNEFFNLNYSDDIHTQFVNHELNFCPLDTNFYSIVSTMDLFDLPGFRGWVEVDRSLNSFLISFKQYHLNADIYNYYYSLNKQLSAKQRILDPVSFQIKGNMSCTTNPDESVLGIFEVSSFTVLTYTLQTKKTADKLIFQKRSPIDMDTLQDNGRLYYKYPNFWTF